MEGHIKSPLQLLAAESTLGVLPLASDIDGASARSVLLKKHPQAQAVHPPSVISQSTTLPPCHPVVFDHIYGSLIRAIVLQLDGAAGPSGLDSSAGKRLYTYFYSDSTKLSQFNALAALHGGSVLGLHVLWFC